eukprot:754583-Hanusia_phi.AAC.5
MALSEALISFNITKVPTSCGNCNTLNEEISCKLTTASMELESSLSFCRRRNEVRQLGKA